MKPVMLIIILNISMSVAYAFDRENTEAPKRKSPLSHSVIIDSDRAGSSIVAVGQLGLIIVSDDEGQTWEQQSAPASSDLNALDFVDSSYGWAVGHDGVVLKTVDGGKTWIKQLDSESALLVLRSQYLRTDERVRHYNDAFVQKISTFYPKSGADFSFLDVKFLNRDIGYVVGMFNQILYTENGGESWRSLMHLTENKNDYHLYGVEEVGGSIYLVGERGLVLMKPSAGQFFQALSGPTGGTWFGVVDLAGSALLYGLRGRIAIHREENWDFFAPEVEASILDMVVDGESAFGVTSDGSIISISVDGSFSHLQCQDNCKAYTLELIGRKNLISLGEGSPEVKDIQILTN